jgi:signal transduction histidine kinase
MRLDGHTQALRANAWWLYLAAMLPLAGLYLFGPNVFDVGAVFNVIGVSAVIAIVAGLLIQRPSRKAPWIMFAVGQTLFVTGDVLAYNYKQLFGHTLPFPSVADVAYLGVGPTIVIGLALLIRQRSQGRDWGSAIDSVIITTGVALVSWIFLISPYAYDRTLSLPTKLTSIAYPLMDLLIISATIRLTVGRGMRGVSYWLMIASVCSLFATDSAYGWLELHGGYTTGGLLDGGWIAFYLLWGAAALHPSMAASSVGGEPVRLTRKRLLALAAATFTAPLTAMIARHTPDDNYVIGGCAIFLFSLVLLRMVGMMKAQEAAAGREFALDHERAQNRRLLEIDRLKDRFVATVSHELRTPLTSIHGYLDIMLGGEAGEFNGEQHRFLSIVARNSDRLLRLADDLLLVSVADAGLELRLEPVDLRVLAENSVESAQAAAQAAGISLDFSAERAFPILGDAGRLGQLLDNLISNALKFTPRAGRVSITIDRSGDSARLEIADTGMGIPADEQEFLFDRFFRSEAADKQAIQGAGLGLSIAQDIAKAHGGRIDFTSVEHVGTTFRVELPLAPVTANPLPLTLAAA